MTMMIVGGVDPVEEDDDNDDAIATNGEDHEHRCHQVMYENQQ